jgi:hypothetical protein
MILQFLNDKLDNLVDVHFGDIMKRGIDPSERIYEPCFDLIKINDHISDVMKDEFKI